MSSDRKRPDQQQLALFTDGSGAGKTAAVAGELTAKLVLAYEEDLWDCSLFEPLHEDAAEVEADLAEISAYVDELRASSDFRESAQGARFYERLSGIEKQYREHLCAITGAVIDLSEQEGDASASHVLPASQVAMRASSNDTEPSPGISAAVPSSPRFALRLLLPRKNRKQIIGDLIEEFYQVYREGSPRRARIFFWWQATREIARSLLITFLKLSGFATAAEALRRYIGS